MNSWIHSALINFIVLLGSFSSLAIAEDLQPRTALEAKAKQIDAKILSQNFVEVEHLLGEMLLPAAPRSRIGDLSLFTIANSLFEQSAPTYQPGVEAWVKAKPESVWASVIHAKWLHRWAWEARGTRYSDQIPAEAEKLYRERLVRASAELERADKLDPSNILVSYLQLAFIKERGASIAERQASFEKVNLMHPNSWAIHYEYIVALAPKWGGESEEALFTEARRLAAAAPQNSPIIGIPVIAQDLVCAAHGGKKEYLKQTNVWTEREQAYKGLLARFPNAGYFAATYAADAFLTDRKELGVEMLKVAMAKEGDNPEVRKVQRRYGHLISDLNSLGGTPEVHRDMVTGVLEEAKKASKAKNYPEAERLYRKATELHPTRSNSWHMLGAMIAQQGRYKEAIPPYERATQLNSKRASYFTQLCYARMMANDLQQGIEDCTKAIAIDANEKYAYLNRARAYKLLGKSSEAEADFIVGNSLKEYKAGQQDSAGKTRAD